MVLTLEPASFFLATRAEVGWPQLGDIGLALVLSALVGLERELRGKSAGIRTHSLVGVGAALFMLISKYGFTDVLEAGRIVVDPSRVAAQIVTGIGFLGAGIIFVKRDSVRGLTTAAGIWITAAIGGAVGAGLVGVALLVTAAYFVISLGFPLLTRLLPVPSNGTAALLRVRYRQRQEVLARLLQVVTARGFALEELSHEGVRAGSGAPRRDGEPRVVEVLLHVHGQAPVGELTAALSQVDGVESVEAGRESKDT